MAARGRIAAVAVGWGCAAAALAAPAPRLADYPLFLSAPVVPNVLVLLDNSESMDATMAGKVISGDDPNTRANIARDVLRQVITSHRAVFNWGLGTFELADAPYLYNTQALYLGSDLTMVYTDSCSVPWGSPADFTGYSVDGPQVPLSAAGVTPVAYRDNCVQNPDAPGGVPANGKRYITFEVTADDAGINDVYYTSSTADFVFGIGVPGEGSGHKYKLYPARKSGTGWAPVDFVSCSPSDCAVDFTPTDAGWLPAPSALPRLLLLKRGWGYGASISGRGRVVQPVKATQAADASAASQVAAADAQYAALMSALGVETYVSSSGEIKNAAAATPLAGTVQTARDYFAGRLGSTLPSPITLSCQRNYVVLATDGNPTGKVDGSQYLPSDWNNTPLADGSWRYGQAQIDVFQQIGSLAADGRPLGGLRATSLNGSSLSNAALAGRSFDVQTYVIGLGDTVANASSVAALNEMARLGGGTPTAFLGNSVDKVKDSFQQVVSSIQRQRGSGGAVTLSANLLSTTTAAYQPSFDSRAWSGDLTSSRLDPNGAFSSRPLWSASALLAAQDPSGRVLLTSKPSAPSGARGIALRWPVDPANPTARELDAVQTAALSTASGGATDGFGRLRLDYLRGDRSLEATRCPTCAPRFRDRASPLGDIVDSTPVLVGTPSGNYYDDIESSAYGSFVASQRDRARVLYVGANDGMLHGFDATSGRELFGYVPSAVFGGLSALTAIDYRHRYFVDGTPTVGDAFYAGGWHSLLVSGLRAGGKGVFALDVTDPAGFTEANATNIVRWEFTHDQDADMGYLYSQPVIAKTNNGRWSVIVANGYDSGSASGHAVLFVIDAETGVARKIDTGAGSPASPNGLSGPVQIDTNDDGIADIVYAGDLNGNLWKFDLSAASPTAWGVANGGAPLFRTDASQPDAGTHAITGRPNVTAFPRGGYMVVFGSGRYLSTDDAASNAQQALYGIWDNLLPGQVAASSLVQQSVSNVTATGSDGVAYRLVSHAVGPPTDAVAPGDLPTVTLADYYVNKRGWTLPLPSTGERSVTDARIRGGRAIFTTLIPGIDDPCLYGGGGWLMEVDVFTGNRDARGTFDTNRTGTVEANDSLPFGNAGNNVASGRYVQGIPASPASVARPADPTGPVKDACTEIRYIQKSDGTTETVIVACGKSSSGRAQWRELR